MIPIDNPSPLPHASFEKKGPGDTAYDVLVVRGTFDFAADDQALTLAAEQRPIQYGDVFAGSAQHAPLRAVLRREGDLVLHKPSTDVMVLGTAHARDGLAVPSWVAGVQVGALRKGVRLYGQRRFDRGLFGWRLTEPEPTAAVPLDYRLAFGGCFTVPAEGETPAAFVRHADNPAGCGWLPDAADLRGIPARARGLVLAEIRSLKQLDAPQIEDPATPVTHPTQSCRPEGLGPLARWCGPRLQYAGTFDEALLGDGEPRLAPDFDLRYYQAAHPDLIAETYVTGDEPIVLGGLLPEGLVRMRLPGTRVLAMVYYASGRCQGGPLVLDTVTIDLDARKVDLTWRAAFERGDPVRALSVGALDLPDVAPREARHG